MQARTKSLFHFTPTIDNLLLILGDGFWPRYSLEDISWMDVGISKLAWPMISFCDIPISRLKAHTDFYGNYGIGLCREQWSATGLNPVLYVSPGSLLKDSLRELLLDVRNNPDRRSNTNAMVLLAHCKEMEGMVMRNGEMKRKDFYSECEWRFIPWVEGVGGENKPGFLLSEEEYRDDHFLKLANDERRAQMLMIEPSDVRYLLVKTQKDVHAMIGFIDSEMGHYSNIARDMLKTRILVLDDVSCDL